MSPSPNLPYVHKHCNLVGWYVLWQLPRSLCPSYLVHITAKQVVVIWCINWYIMWKKINTKSSSSKSSLLAKHHLLSHSLPYKILPHLYTPSWIRPSDFHFFGFHNIHIFTERGRQSWVQHLTWWTRSLYLCPPVTGWPSYTPRHWVPFSSPSTTCGAMVEVF
jgi:hypothetical protein